MKALIVDDERLARVELIEALKNYPEIEVVAEASNYKEVLDILNKNDIDLMFLDIQMPEKTGFELLEMLDSAPNVVFVTAYDEYAIKGFEVNALDYLLKPIEPQRLEKTIQKVLSTQNETNGTPQTISDDKLGLNDQIFLKDGEKCWFVKLQDVRMFESEGNYIRVFFENSKPLILKSLNSLEEKLDDKYFFRANRKFVINLNWVDKIETWFNGGLQVTLKSGEVVEVSRRQSVKFKDKMSL